MSLTWQRLTRKLPTRNDYTVSMKITFSSDIFRSSVWVSLCAHLASWILENEYLLCTFDYSCSLTLSNTHTHTRTHTHTHEHTHTHSNTGTMRRMHDLSRDLLVVCVHGFHRVDVDDHGDVCDNIWTGNTKSGNRGLFQVNLANETVDIQNITINVAEKVEAVLRCQGGCTDIESTCNDLPSMSDTNTGCDSTNNLLDILAVQDEFNFTSEIQPSIDDILAYAPDLNYSSQIDTARQSLNTDAVNDALNYDYDFSGNLTEVKSQIANFSALVPLCESSCDNATVSGESDSWQAIWLVGASDVNCAYLTSTMIDGSDTYYSSNCNLVTLIGNIDTSVDSCNASTLNVTASQTLIANGISSVDTALGSADATILLKQDELVQQADLLGVLIAYIPEEAPGHLTCSWISGAWSTTIEGDVCTHAYDSMQAAFPGMALCISECSLPSSP